MTTGRRLPPEGRDTTASRAVRRLLAVPAAVVLALTAVGAVPGAASASLQARWAACTEEDLLGFDCAALEVPLDHDRPRGVTTTVALARRPADDPAHKIGTIFVNPGGPGGAGRGLVTVANRLVASDVLARFDIVGFDPRGIGASDPVQCFPTDSEAEALFAQMRAVPLTRSEVGDTIRANLRYAAGCVRNAGPLLEHMSSTRASPPRSRRPIRPSAALPGRTVVESPYEFTVYRAAPVVSL